MKWAISVLASILILGGFGISQQAFAGAFVGGSPVGGTILPIDTTSLLVAGAQTISPWLILGLVSAIGIGLAVFTLKRNHVHLMRNNNDGRANI